MTPTPESLIGPAAAKALAEHYDITPKAKPLPEIVTDMECRHFWDDYEKATGTAFDAGRTALSAFVLRWLRARLEKACDYQPTREYQFLCLTGREWSDT